MPALHVRLVRLAVLAGASLACGASFAGGPAVLVVDSSGSMWGRLEGRTKVEIAREAVDDALAYWPAERPLGVVAYGHRSKTDCADIETVVPVAPFDAARVRRAVAALRPNGMTPIAASLQAALRALPQGGEPGTIVLVSDGEETCGVDPCSVARDIKSRQASLVVHVVGFDVGGTPAGKQLACVAAATGGRYFDARDARALSRAIGAAVRTADLGVAKPAAATLAYNGTAPAAARIDAGWTGPGDPLDFLAFARPGSADGEYVGTAYTREELVRGSKAQVPTPAEPGRYELRYVSPMREPSVLARLAVEVVGGAITISAPDTAPAAGRVAVETVGPGGARHWIALAARGAPIGDYVSYERPDPSGKSRISLTTPATPGEYEIRYILNESESIGARRPIRIVAAQASFEGLRERYGVQEPVSIAYEGPRGQGNWLGFVQRGKGPEAYGSFGYIPEQGPVEFFAPAEPGEYDFVLVVPVDGVDTVKQRTPVSVR